MKKSYLLILILFLTACNIKKATVSYPANVENAEFFKILDHGCFVIHHNNQYKQANWVAYTLRKEHLEGEARRKNNFKPDPMLMPYQSASLADYKGSGYDRGHLAPAGDFKWSQECMDKSFYLSNISPQDPQQNRGVWKRLEDQVREYAAKYDSVLVVTGPVFQKNVAYNTLGSRKVVIPHLYYKALLVVKEGEKQTIAFVVPNEGSRKPLEEFVITVDSLEKLSGIDFFHHLPKKIQKKIEAEADFSKW